MAIDVADIAAAVRDSARNWPSRAKEGLHWTRRNLGKDREEAELLAPAARRIVAAGTDRSA